MSGIIKRIICFLIVCAGLAWIFRHTLQRTKVSILCYHDPPPGIFEAHLEFLTKRFNVITLDTFLDALEKKDASSLPPRSVVITFDDGYRGNYALIPLLHRYQVTPTIFLTTGIVDTYRAYWFRAAGVSPRDLSRLLKMPSKERLERLRTEFTFSPTHAYPQNSRQALSLDEMHEMIKFVDFGAHTRFHPVLTLCDKEETRQEITASKEDVESILHRECRHFSYPHGDYTEREIKIVRQAGFRSARTIDLGWNTVNSDPCRLRVTGVSDNATVMVLSAQMTNIPSYLATLLSGTGTFSGKHRVIRSTSQSEKWFRHGKSCNRK